MEYKTIFDGLTGDEHIAVMFSGGLDSVYLTDLILRETTHPLTALNITTDSLFGACHLPSVVEILNALTSLRRAFDSIILPAIASGQIPYFQALFALGGLSRGNGVTHWMIGECGEETAERAGMGIHENYVRNAENIVEAGAFYSAAVLPPPPQRIPWAGHNRVVNKRQEIEYLDDDIAALCWWCDAPIVVDPDNFDYIDCEKCRKCIDIMPLFARKGVAIDRPAISPTARIALANLQQAAFCFKGLPQYGQKR